MPPVPPASRSKTAALAPIALAMLGAFAGLFAAAAVQAQPRSADRLAAVFPPWWTPAQVAAAAASAGDIAGAGGVGFIVILRGDPANLAQRARASGAIALLDPALAGVCADPAREADRP